MIEDLTSDDNDDGAPQPGPAFTSLPRMGPSELPMYEVMHLRGAKDFLGASEVLFTMLDEETGEVIWDPSVPPNFHNEGKRWAKIMSWSRIPTIAEARQFQLNARMGLQAAWWSRMSAARAEDDARRPGDFSTKSAGLYAGMPET
jgi:hypothetical protein